MANRNKNVASVLAFLASIICVFAAQANSQTAELCELAAEDAARRAGVPAQILQVLTLTETGRELDGVLRPWPWAINHAGAGQWFDSQAEMLAFAQDLIAAGDTNFDLGCFQLNYRWHQQAFASLESMTAPMENAAYAADYLNSKQRETGSWERAIGAYHSSTEELAQKYLARFFSILSEFSVYADLPQIATSSDIVPAIEHVNNFPLLVFTRARPGPSLFPDITTRHRLIGVDE